MNALDTEAMAVPRAAATIHPTHTFRMLLKREYWEHKGGFFWAPAIAGGIALLFTILAAIGVSLMKRRAGNEFHLEGADPEHITRALGGAGDVALMGGIGIAMVVMGFVVFFYSLGSLYDDRKDRSVLFWKSMPVSDAITVTSKATWALVLAPLLALAVGIAVGLAFWVITALTTTVNGVPGASAVFMHSHPIRVIVNVVGMVPLYMLWALPAVGWLMLCSATARSKPFLWAVLVPVLGCALVSFANVVLGLGYDVGPLWYVAAYRPLLSVFPSTWLPKIDDDYHVRAPDDIANIVDAGHSWALAGSVDLWVGAIAGVAMILVAIRMRRWRDEG